MGVEQQQFSLGIESLVHDLNNVLQTILHASDLIASDPEHREVAAIIARTVDQGRRILSDAVGVDRRASIDLALESAIQFASDYAGTRQGPQTDFCVETDRNVYLQMRPAALERTLVNLFVNAQQAALNAGMRRVLIRITARFEGSDFVLRVADNGPGIPAGLLRYIFTPRLSRHLGGQGLGLYIVQTSVMEGGGSITAANGEAGGAVFTMRFPASATIRASAATSSIMG